MAFQDNYEKVVIGIGSLLLVVAGTWTYMYSKNMESTFSLKDTVVKKNTPMKGIQTAENLLTTLEQDHAIERPVIGKQHFDIFVGPRLVSKKGETTAIDIHQSPPIHGEVPNAWFFENNLEDVFPMSNALEVDSDNDGFTNLEEFTAQTHPNDANSYPNLASKLAAKEINLSGYTLAYSSEADPIEFRAEAFNGNLLWKKEVKPGDVFGDKPDVDRFELKEIKTAVIKENDTKVAHVIDLKSGKNEQVYEIPYGKKNAQRIIDKAAVLNISAGSKPGDFKVFEGKAFSIPGDPTKTTYMIESIDNKTKTLVIKPTKGEGNITLSVEK